MCELKCKSKLVLQNVFINNNFDLLFTVAMLIANNKYLKYVNMQPRYNLTFIIITVIHDIKVCHFDICTMIRL